MLSSSTQATLIALLLMLPLAGRTQTGPSMQVVVNSLAASQMGQGSGASGAIGRMTLRDSPYGVYLEPDLAGRSPGIYRAVLRDKSVCDPASLGAVLPPPANPTRAQRFWWERKVDEMRDLPDYQPKLLVDEKGMAQVPLMLPWGYDLKSLFGRTMTFEPMDGGAPIACAILK